MLDTGFHVHVDRGEGVCICTYVCLVLNNYFYKPNSMLHTYLLPLFNLQCVGLQPNSITPTWVIGSNLHVHLAGGVTRRLNANDSPYAVLGSEMAPLPLIDIKGKYGSIPVTVLEVQSIPLIIDAPNKRNLQMNIIYISSNIVLEHQHGDFFLADWCSTLQQLYHRITFQHF